MTSPEGLTTEELLDRLSDRETNEPIVAELRRRIEHGYVLARETEAARDRFAKTARERADEVNRLTDEVVTLNGRLDTVFRILDRLVK